MSPPILVHLPYSPWSEKARWALDHHRIDCRRKAYMPMLGEPGLRMRTGRWTGRVSVPSLVADGVALCDSYDIACWADERGAGAPLRAADPEVRRWNERSDAMLAAGRARTTARVVRDPEALVESIPKPLNALGRAALPIAYVGAAFLRRKYRFDEANDAEHLATIDHGLAALRDALAGGDYLLGELSYADIAMAVALAFVSPHERHSRLGEKSRQCWTEPTLRDRYADLVSWRDRIYAAHRS